MCSTMTGFKTFICSCVYFHFHTDDGLSKNRNVCTYCYAHKIMKFITFALVFSFTTVTLVTKGIIHPSHLIGIENFKPTYYNNNKIK